MKFTSLKSILFIILFTPLIVTGSVPTCEQLQEVVTNETLNGQSNIPAHPFVVAVNNKVYFHTAPDSSCIQHDKFVIAGDYLYAYKIHEGFTYVNYFTVKGNEVKGWVNSSELEELNPIIASPKKNNINISDFIVVSNEDWFGLGNSFSNTLSLSKNHELSSAYIGDFPNDFGGLDKFYSHTYKDFNVISSNVNYNERLWSIDDAYIISDITLTTPKYHTIRNIKVGDRKDDIINKYINIKGFESNSKIIYNLGKMSLTFNLENDVITSIEISSIPE
ncbi:hypothetical protein [Pluralibacter gergoviae]|uniref:SH3 domain-containing protein n=1 Tax=Pluralibacter gergoviae TaxID=61647 RepID=A0AAW8HQT7_PLUGE|nr:hypothetical protein [Pluralibacter gergoviae]MDQ2310827.1 hypothetical protein [Pluralibacter gergoviae]SUB71192.1 Uncharacterised protein [Pluralibacter gergoviae]HDS1115658.1 hypothetical protein [Pluralibacter gergoviae]